MAPLGWSKAQRQRLCHDSSKGINPSLCAQRSKDLRTSGLSTDALIDLCHDADSQAPAECVYECSRSMNALMKVQLCKGARSKGPAQCLKEVPRKLSLEVKVGR